MRRAAELKLRRALVSALLLGAAFPLAGPLAAACAASGSAALVVDTGESSFTYCVSLPSSEVSGIELIQLAGEQHGLQYGLGYGGGAVCQLQGTGPDGEDCFADHPDFWGYWRGDGSGGWAWSGSGAGSTRVEAGDVEGWSWGSGQDGASHQQPPATTHSSVCGDPAPPPKDKDRPAKESSGSSGGSPGGGDGPDPEANGAATAAKESFTPEVAKEQDGERKKERRRKSAHKGDRTPLSPSPDGSPTDGAVPLSSSNGMTEENGAPVAGLAAVGVATLLGGAGFFVRGRRRKLRS